MDFDKDYILESERVLLRPLKKDDFGYLQGYAVHERDLWYYGTENPGEDYFMRNYIATAIKSREMKTGYPFIVFDKSSNEYAGCTRFYDIQPEHMRLQLGYTWYGRKFQGTGLNKNCKFLLLELAFDQLKMHRVEFRADTLNSRSIAAMKSIGCIEEGILRSTSFRTDGTRRDSIVLSILRDDWKRTIKIQLKNQVNL